MFRSAAYDPQMPFVGRGHAMPEKQLGNSRAWDSPVGHFGELYPTTMTPLAKPVR